MGKKFNQTVNMNMNIQNGNYSMTSPIGKTKGGPHDFTKIGENFDPSRPLEESGLCDWIATASTGDSIVYHRGYLLVDRSETLSHLVPSDRKRVNQLARRAWIACELGLVHLFSQRINEEEYRYIAVKSCNGFLNQFNKTIN